MTWTQQTNAPEEMWTGIAMSADGSKLAGVYTNYSYQITPSAVFVSVDYGATWIEQPNSVYKNYNNSVNSGWQGIAMNADGSQGVAIYSGSLYQVPNFITQWSTVNVFSASAYACIEVVYVGNGLWMPSFYTGNFTIQ